MECVSENSYQFHEMNSWVFITFDINESTNALFIEMDSWWRHQMETFSA